MAVSDNLYISDLPVEIDEPMLQQIFGAYGSITSLKVLPPKAPGQRGAALVRFASQQEATWIVNNLHGNMPEGLAEPISVKYANSGSKGAPAAAPPSFGFGKAGGSWPTTERAAPYEPGKDGGGKGGGGKGGSGIRSIIVGASKQGLLPGGGQKPDDQCVYIKGLPKDTTDLELYKLMSPFGSIAQRGVTAMLHPDGSCTSIGFVDFTDPNVAQNVINSLNGFMLPDGSSLFLKTKNARKGGSKGEGKKGGWGGYGK